MSGTRAIMRVLMRDLQDTAQRVGSDPNHETTTNAVLLCRSIKLLHWYLLEELSDGYVAEDKTRELLPSFSLSRRFALISSACVTGCRPSASILSCSPFPIRPGSTSSGIRIARRMKWSFALFHRCSPSFSRSSLS